MPKAPRRLSPGPLSFCGDECLQGIGGIRRNYWVSSSSSCISSQLASIGSTGCQNPVPSSFSIRSSSSNCLEECWTLLRIQAHALEYNHNAGERKIPHSLGLRRKSATLSISSCGCKRGHRQALPENKKDSPSRPSLAKL